MCGYWLVELDIVDVGIVIGVGVVGVVDVLVVGFVLFVLVVLLYRNWLIRFLSMIVDCVIVIVLFVFSILVLLFGLRLIYCLLSRFDVRIFVDEFFGNWYWLLMLIVMSVWYVFVLKLIDFMWLIMMLVFFMVVCGFSLLILLNFIFIE